MSMANQLSSKLKEWGATTTGFCSLPPNWVQYNSISAPEFEGLNYAVSVIVRLSDPIVNGITNQPTYSYFHHYRSVNTLIDQICLKGSLFIQECGHKSAAVAASQTININGQSYSGVFSHKTAAVRAGLGWIGKSDLFLSNDYGPRVRLGTILTDMPLVQTCEKLIYRTEDENFESLAQHNCGECRLCVDNCPAMALSGKMWQPGLERSEIIDPKACSDYMNTNFKHIGRGSVCGICMKVCPKGVKLVTNDLIIKTQYKNTDRVK